MLTKTQIATFESLLRAAQHDQLMLVEYRRKKDGVIVPLAAGVTFDKKVFMFYPYAEIIDIDNVSSEYEIAE